MYLSAFLQSFYLVFLVLISIGPGFLTIANIAMRNSYKISTTAVCGCFLGDCILIAIGIFFARQAISSIPENILIITPFIAVCLLLHLSVKFWKTNVSNVKVKIFEKQNKKNGLSLAITLFGLKMSSPISIIGYSIIFTQITKNSNCPYALYFGGCCASAVVNAIMVSVFGTIGKKINIKILNFVNKISALFIGGFAISIAITALKELLKY